MVKGYEQHSIEPLYDVSRDGDTSNQNRYIGRDEIGYNLNYYSGDYKAIGGIAPFPDPSPQLNTASAYRPLYNGNINSMAVSIRQFNQPYLYDYKYDQLNRLKSVDVFSGLNNSTNAWNSSLTPTLAYNEKFNYDGNGNILNATRYANTTSAPMDILTYHYKANTNKLTYVDQTQNGVNANYKIKNQNNGNYDYDEIGNLIKDSTENIASGGIKWNVYGKISEINKSASSVLTNVKKINYYYDAAGNRIGKKVIKFGSANVAYTWYVRDAQGNALATYTANKDTTTTTTLGSFALFIAEHNLFGGSRLGTQNRQDIADVGSVGQPFYNARGLKFYELGNHLGNVLTSISDKKIGHNNGAGGFDYYNAEVVSATDYYAFGMRSRYDYQDPIQLDYRYGFNGKENDNEVKGGGDQIDYGNRIYDPRIGRWLSIDPLQHKYPNLTPYNAMGNNPLLFIDPSGKTIIINSNKERDLLNSIDAAALIYMTKYGSSIINKLHQSDKSFILKLYSGAEDQYSSYNHTMRFDPNKAISESKGYMENPVFTLGHEIGHAYKDYRQSLYSGDGVEEAAAVNDENYYRSVLGGRKAFRNEYDFGFWDNHYSNKPQDFRENLSSNPNPEGERARFTKREIRGKIKLDANNTYVLQTVGTYDANSKEVLNQKNGIVYFFDYKKDKDAKVEKKAVIIKVVYANKEKS